MLRKLAAIAVVLLLSPLLVPLVAFLVVFSLVVFSLGVSAYSWLWLLCFCWTHVDEVYLVCSRKRGWEPFLRNNLVPVLPDSLLLIWLESPESRANVVRAGRLSNVFLAKPFLIRVTRFRLLSLPLNSQLAELKCLGAISETARRDARKILNAALAELATALPGRVI